MIGIPDVRLHIDEDFQSRQVKLYLFTETHVGEPVVMKPTFLAESPEPPTALLSQKALQELFDEMWHKGYRPQSEPRNTFDQILAEQKDIIEKQQVFIDHLLKEVDALAGPDIIIKGVNR